VPAFANRRREARRRELAEERPDQDIRFEYTPESFTATEPDYALEVCEAVMDVFEPTLERKLILNLPATPQRPRHGGRRDGAGPMAGAERVEGTLFGNGERTGNVDLVTLALDLGEDTDTAAASSSGAAQKASSPVKP
jgi:2-isopropylmalate synthase